MFSNFLLGSLSVTDAARIKLKREPLDLIARHAVNEHGLLTEQEHRRNREALTHAGQIMSRYPVDPTDRAQGYVLVITTEGWDTTVVQLETESSA